MHVTTCDGLQLHSLSQYHTPVQVNTQRRKAGDEHVDAQVKFTAAHQVGPINIALSKVGLCSSFVIRPPGVISPPVTNLLQAGTAISGSGDTSCTANACADTMLRWAGMYNTGTFFSLWLRGTHAAPLPHTQGQCPAVDRQAFARQRLFTCNSRVNRKMPLPCALPVGFIIQTPPLRLNSSTKRRYSRGSTNVCGKKLYASGSPMQRSCAWV